MRCKRGAIKHRTHKPHGNHSHGFALTPFKHSIRGHTWGKHGAERRCINCGCKPRHDR